GSKSTLRWMLHDNTTQKQAEEKVRILNSELEQRIAERTAELEAEKRLRDEALTRERTARMEANAAAARAAFLSEASVVLSSSLDYPVKLSRLARVIVPFLADWCSIDILEDDTTVRRLAVAHADPSKSDTVRQLQQQYQVIRPGKATHTILDVL